MVKQLKRNVTGIVYMASLLCTSHNPVFTIIIKKFSANADKIVQFLCTLPEIR